MPRHPAPFKVRLVGQGQDYPRYVVRDARRVVDHFWTGKGWSRRRLDSRLYHDPDEVAATVKRLTLRHLRRHELKGLYLMRVVVRVHATEDVSRHEIERYLRAALVVGVDHDRFGTGPNEGSLVEVIVPSISLEEGG
jgi:hypothetical protein